MLKFFPEYVNSDEYITEFFVNQDRSHKFNSNKLDPDIIQYSKPDFGYNDFMTFEDEETKGWLAMMDCVAILPKCERLRNYIDFIHRKKIEIIQKKMKKKKKEVVEEDETPTTKTAKDEKRS